VGGSNGSSMREGCPNALLPGSLAGEYIKSIAIFEQSKLHHFLVCKKRPAE
jgi:hypothetical protein